MPPNDTPFAYEPDSVESARPHRSPADHRRGALIDSRYRLVGTKILEGTCASCATPDELTGKPAVLHASFNPRTADSYLSYPLRASLDLMRRSPWYVTPLHLIAHGQTNRLIAAALSLSHLTVDRHVQNIYRKLGVRRRVDTVRHATQIGWEPSHAT